MTQLDEMEGPVPLSREARRRIRYEEYVMTMSRSIAIAGLCGALAGAAAAQQRQPPTPQRVTIPFSDPGRPGLVEIDLVMGSISVKGANRQDVAIEARTPGQETSTRRPPDEAPPGLRRLTQAGSFSVEEDNNEVTVDVSSPMRAIEFTIEVPIRTNLHLETVQGTILVEGVDGDLEIDSVNGTVTLNNVAGSVVAHSVNGKVLATITRTTPQKPMAFTSLNGGVDVTLPAGVKANMRLRSDQGDVYTDFDLQLQPADTASNNTARRRDGRQRIDVNKAIYGTVNGGGPDFEMRTFNGNVYVRKGK
jgi:DUF4097 and DUF4098 domain-containing protein YvlB